VRGHEEETKLTAAYCPASSTGLRPQGGRREGGGGVFQPSLHWCTVAPQPIGGGRGGVGPGVLPAPYYPGPQGRGVGDGQGWRAEDDHSPGILAGYRCCH
jgi:hypothetical protein